MRVGRLARVILAAAPLAVAGCGNFWQAPSSSNSGCTTNCPTTASGNFYILNQETNQIAAYTISSSAALTKISGSPYALSAKPYSIAIDSGGAFLYVGTAAGIYLYTIDSSTGALTIGNSGGVISQDFATTMKIDPSGNWLVESGPDIGEALALSINSSTGVLNSNTEEHVNLPSTSVEQLAISPDGNYVFVALGSGGTVAIPFASGNTNPFGTTLTKIPVKHASGSALSVAVDPSNRLFYVGETLANSAGNAGGLRVFDYTTLTTKLAEVSGSPYASGGLAPNSILSEGTGAYVYVANGQGTTKAGNVAEFTIATSGTTYSLTAGSTTAAGTQPSGLAEDSTSVYVLVVSSGGSPDLSAFSFDSTTLGKLDSVLTGSTGTDPVQAVAVSAAGGQ